MKNNDKKARTTLESHRIQKMAQFLKVGKNGHFAKVM